MEKIREFVKNVGRTPFDLYVIYLETHLIGFEVWLRSSRRSCGGILIIYTY